MSVMVPTVRRGVQGMRSPSPLNPNRPEGSGKPPRHGDASPKTPVTPNSPMSPLDRVMSDFHGQEWRRSGTASRSSNVTRQNMGQVQLSAVDTGARNDARAAEPQEDLSSMTREQLENLVRTLQSSAMGPMYVGARRDSRPSPVTCESPRGGVRKVGRSRHTDPTRHTACTVAT